jgi:hypothetical protein
MATAMAAAMTMTVIDHRCTGNTTFESTANSDVL